ncbi:hypothetical protein [Maribellus maritimus]|uniref:hypothetical protein n=1 Tax=Maribellus maritimus TaxID=2870838 RepID=UPI001EEBD81B|nr:hypothetical protein [Maribellus maritimus]MCG6190077.1 hypothetical protein [Maribellus maritimus]
MRTLRYILTLVLITNILILNGQDKCECCTYYSIENEDLYEYFFNSDFIKANLIKQAIVYTTETNEQNSFRFQHAKFLFDSNGNISARYDYNQNGKPHMIKEYFRDDSGMIIKTSKSYLKEDESKTNSWSPTIIDYFYNQAGLLIKIKERDNKGNVISDSLSEYTTYNYDSKGRMIKEYRYANYSGSIYIYEQDIDYPSDKESIGITKNNGNDWLKTSSRFDSKARLIQQTDYDFPDNEIVWDKEYIFLNDRLTEQISKRGNGFTECPDNDEFTEDYFYNYFGLLEKINHKFDRVTCEMIIEYE